jgi:hypothetical protein
LEQHADESDLASDAWFFMMDVAALVDSERLDAAERRSRRSQGSETLTVSKEPFHRGVVALDQVVLPFSVDVPDAIEMRVTPMIDLTDDTPISVCLIGTDRDGPVQPHALDRLVQEGSGGLRIPPCG